MPRGSHKRNRDRGSGYGRGGALRHGFPRPCKPDCLGIRLRGHLGPKPRQRVSAWPRRWSRRQGRSRLVPANKGSDADHLKRRPAAQGTEAVIPSTASRREPVPSNILAYKDRNRVERMGCSLKDFRRVATRYDTLAGSSTSACSRPHPRRL